MSIRHRACMCVASLLAAGLAAPISAQQPSDQQQSVAAITAIPGSSATPTPTRPERLTLEKLSRPLTVEFQQTRLEDVIKFLAVATGADIEPLWEDDNNSSGLSKDALITLSAKELGPLGVVEKVLQAASQKGDPMENSWQMASTGAIQVGPKMRLNDFKRLAIYDASDLLAELPRYANAPDFDLQAALQSQGAGGGAQNPLRENQGARGQDPAPDRQKVAAALIDLITSFIETDQWSENGGTGGSIRQYQGSLLINAPDYMHRQIAGYDYWPHQAVSLTGAYPHR